MEDPNSPEIIRMACSLCRRRKLKCNRQTPRCDSCIKLQQECVYGVVRLKKPTRKDRTKTLEGRLAQIEKLLRIQDDKKPEGSQPSPASQSPNDEPAAEVEEDTIRELENIYFEKIHPSIPMLHRERYTQSTLLEPTHQPPIFLRHAIWAAAASVSTEHSNLEAPLCYSSRKYLEDAELRDAHLESIGIAHVQTWVLIASIESKNTHSPRFWMSTGRAVRMAQLMGLHRMDAAKVDRNFAHLAKEKDWVQKEECRRTFWMAFCLDRYVGMGTGWSTFGIDDRDIDTLLPCHEELYQNSKEETKPLSLMEGMTPQGTDKLSPFPALIVITALSCRKMLELKRMEVSELTKSGDVIGAFLHKYRWLDSTLRTICIPNHLRMPTVTNDPLVIFLNMICHTGTISVLKMAFEKYRDAVSIEMVEEGKGKCLEAAVEITNCMRCQSVMDLSIVHQFTPFCLYKAATVFADCIFNWSSTNPHNSPTPSPTHHHYLHSLSFLIMSMNSLKAVNPLVNAFLHDLYEDFPNLNEWLNSPSTINPPLPETDSVPVIGEGDVMSAWDSRMGFYQRLSKEKEVDRGGGDGEGVDGGSVVNLNPELGVDRGDSRMGLAVGIGEFSFDFGGDVGMGNGGRGGDDFEFLNLDGGNGDWNI